jgi:hypothetical protein
LATVVQCQAVLGFLVSGMKKYAALVLLSAVGFFCIGGILVWLGSCPMFLIHLTSD